MSILSKLPFTKSFWKNLNYASTANIRDFVKFYNLGDQSFQTGLTLSEPGGGGRTAHLKFFLSIEIKLCITLDILLKNLSVEIIEKMPQFLLLLAFLCKHLSKFCSNDQKKTNCKTSITADPI